MKNLFQRLFQQRRNSNLFKWLVVFGFLSLCCQSEVKTETKHASSKSEVETGGKKPHPFVIAYPEFIDSVSANTIYWKDGTKMPLKTTSKKEIDLKKISDKEFEKLLATSDPFMMLSPEYPYLKEIKAPGKNEDPGRFRNTEFLKKVYGANQSKVGKNLVTVKWLRKNVNKSFQVNKMNGAAASLQKISDELDKLPKKFMKYLDNPAGTFMWRNIAGTDNLSAHSFAIAIDINVNQSHYWRGYKKEKDGLLKFRNNIPMEIVEIFEKHGWIWGGRWYHFDTMHFEYRPEIIESAKRR